MDSQAFPLFIAMNIAATWINILQPTKLILEIFRTKFLITLTQINYPSERLKCIYACLYNTMFR
jgi:hypothetical protein